jgi:orotidine-5'-phosphate decarboxylase
MNCSEKLIIALDFPSGREALAHVKRLITAVRAVRYFKVGNQLFTREGPKIVRDIQEAGGEVFLDLKFHDIPNTVFQATRSAMELRPFMMNVHVSGGMEMMKAAREAVDQFHKKGSMPLLIGVTVLTSLTDSSLSELKIAPPVRELAVHYARLAKKAGLDGVVCSVSDVAAIKREIGKDFVAITPGIRLTSSRPASSRAQRGISALKDDQKRVATVEMALKEGSDYLVLGRSLFQSENPPVSLKALVKKCHSEHKVRGISDV